MTNFDRIKNMTVEEMSEFIASIYDDNETAYTANKNIEGDTILDYDEWEILKWLLTEVKND